MFHMIISLYNNFTNILSTNKPHPLIVSLKKEKHKQQKNGIPCFLFVLHVVPSAMLQKGCRQVFSLLLPHNDYKQSINSTISSYLIAQIIILIKQVLSLCKGFSLFLVWHVPTQFIGYNVIIYILLTTFVAKIYSPKQHKVKTDNQQNKNI